VISGDDVVHDVAIAAPPEAVWAMFVDPARLVRWIGISADLEPVAGGRFRFEIVPGQYCEGCYLELEPPRLLRFSWGWTDPAQGVPPGASTVLVELTAATVGGAPGTLLRLTHTGLSGPAAGRHDGGWSHFLVALVAAVDAAEEVAR
jgi:uncharacterized protein YndB with AHSA1/START domain